MGRLVENERIKLRASYLNSVAAGLTIAGALIPFLALVAYAGRLADRIANGGPPAFVEIASAIGACMAFGMALQGALSLRRAATAVLGNLTEGEDQSSN